MMLTQQQIDDMLNASREADEGPTALVRRVEAAAVAAERERLLPTMKRTREAMVLLAALAGSYANSTVPWVELNNEARALGA